MLTLTADQIERIERTPRTDRCILVDAGNRKLAVYLDEEYLGEVSPVGFDGTWTARAVDERIHSEATSRTMALRHLLLRLDAREQQRQAQQSRDAFHSTFAHIEAYSADPFQDRVVGTSRYDHGGLSKPVPRVRAVA